MKFLLAAVPLALASTLMITKPVGQPVLVAENSPAQESKDIPGVGGGAKIPSEDRARLQKPIGQTLSIKVHRQLKKDKALGNFSKDVIIENNEGQITLKGQVPYRADETNIVNRVRAMSGVTGVTNELKVKSE